MTKMVFINIFKLLQSTLNILINPNYFSISTLLLQIISFGSSHPMLDPILRMSIISICEFLSSSTCINCIMLLVSCSVVGIYFINRYQYLINSQYFINTYQIFNEKLYRNFWQYISEEINNNMNIWTL